MCGWIHWSHSDLTNNRSFSSVASFAIGLMEAATMLGNVGSSMGPRGRLLIRMSLLPYKLIACTI